MNDNGVKNRIQKLREEISRLRFEYHVTNNPKVTDDVYESLTRELHDLEEKYPACADPNSAVNRVAGAPQDKFNKVTHKIRMLSMNDSFSKEEVSLWEKRVSKLLNADFSYFCELKLDGLAISLIYENGVFIKGATRGDGFIGEDVTENLKMIETIPLKLKSPHPAYVEVRGEAVMPKRIWRKLNREQESAGKPAFANTRNAAAGSIRQLDPNIVKERSLDFFAWDLEQLKAGKEAPKIIKHSEKHDYLRKLGFQVAPYEKKAKNLEEVFSFIEEIGKIKEYLPYGTDGVVISVDELPLEDKLGVVGKAPRYMTAYKYPAERATTIVTDITTNVGRTGAITPLAHFNPTLVAGSTISKATLHNMDQINRLDIRIGDTVVIQKAGDVIPEVVEVLAKMRDGHEKKFKMPKTCPVCGAKIEQRISGSKQISSSQGPRISSRTLGQTIAHKNLLASGNNSVAYYCTNKDCPAKNRRGMQHFVSVFEIYDVGPKILDRLKDEGLISDAADLFTLSESDISGLERFGEKSAQNIIASIASHRKIPLWRFIYALGILHVGEQTAKDIADHFGTLDKIANAESEEINKIENIGPVVSDSVYKYFHKKANMDFIGKLFKNDVTIEKSAMARGSKLAGKIFVLTGTLSSLSREEAKQKITGEGGRISGSVSKNTSYVVVGDEPGSKYNDAINLGISILDEKSFLKLL
ncbi:MAG TPA: NAD-dependent DNA ligase LigA [Candidatus Paceibacterota bacterium]|jgi:DNA ligase (NAD+)|nr:NAD-dependent DNA ligase LigA [Candidatus Paceibacterota bacterium]